MYSSSLRTMNGSLIVVYIAMQLQCSAACRQYQMFKDVIKHIILRYLYTILIRLFVHM